MPENISGKVDQILETALKVIAEAKNTQILKEIEIKYLGRKGELTELLKNLKDLSPEEKPKVGQTLQKAKNEFQNKYDQKLAELENEEITKQLTTEFFDITLPGFKPQKGNVHPLSQLQEEVENIFTEMGFSIMDGPEVESEYYNFEALNIPAHHPARDMQDTFFLENQRNPEHGHLVLRTQTSPVQIRSMLKYGAPLKMIVPGRVFRYEATDATHDSTFNQVEGLLIDKKISLSDLKGVMAEFLRRLFQKEVKIRFRPGYFPFVEPGIELDILWKRDSQGKDKWMEFMGAGMVHPHVLKAGGVDSSKYQGWAFGFGLTRLAMIKYGIDDIRLLLGNDLRFLNQF